MTQRLYEMLKEKYPEEWHDFSIYGAYERINVSLNDRIFIDNYQKDLINLSELNELSKRYFDGFYNIKDCKDTGYGKGYIVLLETVTSKGKKFFLKTKNYDAHSFWFPHFSPPLDIEISTGNRGRVDLTNEQRKKYFNFVNDLFWKFKENALKVL